MEKEKEIPEQLVGEIQVVNPNWYIEGQPERLPFKVLFEVPHYFRHVCNGKCRYILNREELTIEELINCLGDRKAFRVIARAVKEGTRKRRRTWTKILTTANLKMRLKMTSWLKSLKRPKLR